MNLETKITIYKFTPQVFTLTLKKLLYRHSLRLPIFQTMTRLLSIWQRTLQTLKIGSFQMPVKRTILF